MKEETYPAAANKPLFMLAPVLAFIPALLDVGGDSVRRAAADARGDASTWCVADLPIGFLFILAITSLGVYGIVLAGWSSNNKYALLGGLRSSAQMVSYEIAMGMSTIPVLLLAGNVTLNDDHRAAGARRSGTSLSLTIAFFIFLIAAFAETNRLPFDLPEAESELIAGYHTEYSAMKFSLFFIAEYANMVTASALMATLFFGGWDIPFTLWDNTGAVHGAGKTLLTVVRLRGEGAVLPLPLHVDPLDAAALPLRPADVARLEVHAAAGARRTSSSSRHAMLVLDAARAARAARDVRARPARR